MAKQLRDLKADPRLQVAGVQWVAGGPAHSRPTGTLEWGRDTRRFLGSGVLWVQALMRSLVWSRRASSMVPGVSLIPDGGLS